MALWSKWCWDYSLPTTNSIKIKTIFFPLLLWEYRFVTLLIIFSIIAQNWWLQSVSFTVAHTAGGEDAKLISSALATLAPHEIKGEGQVNFLFSFWPTVIEKGHRSHIPSDIQRERNLCSFFSDTEISSIKLVSVRLNSVCQQSCKICKILTLVLVTQVTLVKEV